MRQIRKNIQIDAENLETIEFPNGAGYNVLQIKKAADLTAGPSVSGIL